MRPLRTRKTLYIAASLCFVLGLAAIAYFSTASGAAAQDEEQQLQTSVARQGNLSLTASGTGSLVAAAEIQVGFESGGELTELLVQVGDIVEAGQALARIDDEQARLQLQQAETTLRELTSPAAVAAAQQQVAEAQDALQTVQYTYNSQQEGNRASSDTLKAAKAKLLLAREQMDRVKGAYDDVSGLPSDDPQKAQAYLSYLAVKKNYNSALGSYNWYTGHPTEIQQAQLEADVAVAQANQEQAQMLLAALTGEALSDDAYGSGLTQLEQAQQTVETARQAVEATTLTAPISGTVTVVEAIVGQNVSGTFITLMDLSRPVVEFYVDETDVDKVTAGAEVEVVFDSYPDLVLSGEVARLDPVLTNTGGVTAAHGYASLQTEGVEDLPRLLVGLSAAIDVIAARVTGAVIIPVEALREVAPGAYGVFVVDGSGALTLRQVEVALQDGTFAAITSGLEVGETVSTGIAEVNS